MLKRHCHPYANLFFAPKSLYINERNAKSAFTSYELEGRVFFSADSPGFSELLVGRP
jgi:hypothetical protein